jgi:TonB family protein
MHKVLVFIVVFIGNTFSNKNEDIFYYFNILHNNSFDKCDFHMNNISFKLNKKLSYDSLFIIKDEDAEFPNGGLAFTNYLKQNLVYPSEEKIKGVSGTVYVLFTINEVGNIEDIKILRGIKGFPNLDNEALRLIKNMPKWNPAIKNGKPIKTRYSYPVKFVL